MPQLTRTPTKPIIVMLAALLVNPKAIINKVWARAAGSPCNKTQVPQTVQLNLKTFQEFIISGRADVTVSRMPKLKFMKKWFLFFSYRTIICAHAHPKVRASIDPQITDFSRKFWDLQFSKLVGNYGSFRTQLHRACPLAVSRTPNPVSRTPNDCYLDILNLKQVVSMSIINNGPEKKIVQHTGADRQN